MYKKFRNEPHAAAASSSSASYQTGQGTWGRNHDSLERVHRELYRAMAHAGIHKGQRIPTDVQQSISQVLQNSFPEWTWCEIHGRILDNKTNMAGPRDPACGTCSVQPVMEAYTSSCESVPSNFDQLVAVRTEWSSAFEELSHIKEKVELDGQRVTDSGMGIYASLDKKELQLWQAYSVVVFDIVRRHIIRSEYTPRVVQIAQGKPKSDVIVSAKKQSPNLEKYERLLVDWTVDAVSHSGGMRPVNQLFCFVHNRVGDMVPVQGFDGYDSSCWICPLAVDRSQSNHSSRFRLTASTSTSTFVESKDITLLKPV